MKRFTAILLGVIMVFALAACRTETTIELALVTDMGTIDDGSFNQGAWEGLVEYAEKNDITHMYFPPASIGDDAYLDAIDLAVEAGAKLVVTPGFLFEVAIWYAQASHPDVKFVLLDGAPRNADRSDTTIGDNTVAVFYAEEQAGFLAGYAAVMDGYRSLGFIGGVPVPAVIRFGYGFVQGAEYAADKLGLDDVTVLYNYAFTFSPSPEVQALAASWYNAGVEVIFACGGGLGFSVMAAAEQNNGKVIGVDRDQAPDSETVITSAMKGLAASVYQSIAAFYDGAFPGGERKIFYAANGGVGLPIETSRFNTFTTEQYEAIFNQLANDEIEIISEHEIEIAELGLERVTVTEIN